MTKSQSVRCLFCVIMLQRAIQLPYEGTSTSILATGPVQCPVEELALLAEASAIVIA